MSEILVNGKDRCEGAFSFSLTKETPSSLSVEGVLRTGTYFEEIHSIENDRYRLEKVDVFQESYGSEEDHIVYRFTAGKYDLRGRKKQP